MDANSSKIAEIQNKSFLSSNWIAGTRCRRIAHNVTQLSRSIPVAAVKGPFPREICLAPARPGSQAPIGCSDVGPIDLRDVLRTAVSHGQLQLGLKNLEDAVDTRLAEGSQSP